MENDIAQELQKRRLTTPDRQTLLDHYARTEELCRFFIAAECFIIIVVLLWVVLLSPRPTWVAWTALGLGALGVFRRFLYHIFLSKKRLHDVRPDAKFGDHTRDSLVNLTENVFRRLRLAPNSVPVFLIRDKDVNAQALRWELWPGLHFFNGVFLNRSIVHLLDERELAYVIGHELGHVFPYAPLVSRCYVLHSVFAGVLCFAIALVFPYVGVAFFAPLGVLALIDLLIAFPYARISRTIEFLCDDFGAQAAGLLPSMSCEFKLAIEEETRQRLLLQTFESQKEGKKANPIELIEAYEEAVPFGKANPEEFQRELQNARRTAKKEGISLGGFLRYLQGNDSSDDDSQEWLNEQLQRLRKLEALPAIDVNREELERGSASWNEPMAEHLMNALTSEPHRVLARVPLEVDDSGASHPSASRRLLFLWRNRDAYLPTVG